MSVTCYFGLNIKESMVHDGNAALRSSVNLTLFVTCLPGLMDNHIISQDKLEFLGISYYIIISGLTRKLSNLITKYTSFKEVLA